MSAIGTITNSTLTNSTVTAPRRPVHARHAACEAPRRPVRLRTPAEAARRVPSRPVPVHVYRRRRLAALAVVVVVLSSVLLLALRVGHADAELDGPPPAAPVYVVRPGDTLWTIAAELAPDGDRRALVERLADSAGGSDLVPGQRIELPRELG